MSLEAGADGAGRPRSASVQRALRRDGGAAGARAMLEQTMIEIRGERQRADAQRRQQHQQRRKKSDSRSRSASVLRSTMMMALGGGQRPPAAPRAPPAAPPRSSSVRSARQQVMRVAADYEQLAAPPRRREVQDNHQRSLVVLRVADGEDGIAAGPAGPTRASASGEDFLQGMERRAQTISAKIRSVSVERARGRLPQPPTAVATEREASLSRNLSRALATMGAEAGGAPAAPAAAGGPAASARRSGDEGAPVAAPRVGGEGAPAVGSVGGHKLRIEMARAIGGDGQRQRHFYRQARQFVSVWDILSNVGEVFERQDRVARHLPSNPSSGPSALRRLVENAVRRGGSIDAELLALLHAELPEKWSGSLMAGYAEWMRAQSPSARVPGGEDAARLRKPAIKKLKAFFKYYAAHADRIQGMLALVLQNDGSDVRRRRTPLPAPSGPSAPSARPEA